MNNPILRFSLSAIVATTGLSCFGQSMQAAEAAPSAEALKFFESKVRPVLAENCYGCHGEDKVKGELRLDHINAILKGGESGPALVKGDPKASLLIEVVSRTNPDLSMPPKEKDALSKEQVADLETWITMGAPWPQTESFTEVERDENGFTAEDKAWWAIQPLAKVTPPDTGKGWAKNAVDRFVARKLEENGLAPAEPASASELLRRIHFDLVGLPPSPEEVIAFSQAYAMDADKAVAAEVDKLLADARYGERWGQHWLDVVRYTDSDGYNADGFRPDAYRYRDYVVNAFNNDKPYNEFVREQLAADEFAPNDPDKLIGTAFLRHGVYEWNQRNAEMQWDLIITEMTNVTGEAFLGIGIGCAQCHDHKFDPILQKDYFALQAFLNSTWWPEDRTLATPEQRAEYEQKLAKWEEATKDIRAELDAMTAPIYESTANGASKVFPDPVKAMYAKDPSERTAYEEQISQLVQRQVDQATNRLDFAKKFEKDEKKLAQYKELQEKLKKFDDIKPEPLPVAFISTDVGTRPAVTKFTKRGGKVPVEPAFLTLLDQPAPKITPTEHTTGQRTALAEWIASEDNPLSTRVMVNRVWQHHFAKGLVPTPNDFGRLGEEPSHPELLDWLTKEFLDNGWKIKPLHRLIMTSATYRQTARRNPGEKESVTDPGNKFFWRYPPKRLDAEQIRDAMLVTSGELKHRDGGPTVDGSATNRSIYVKKRRNTKDPMIGGFDAPLGFNSAPDRLSTTTPIQSLMLVNGDFALKRATAFAKRILDGKTEIQADDIREAYQLAYGRDALDTEVESALYFIRSQGDYVDGPEEAPRKFPNETGLRPTSQVFGDRPELKLGEKSLWLQPDSR
ncbi:MAG: PSD1 domain-containing protein, partial [Verrucomicrobiae bacterium]|nr:PSD1 domain-containing protein [Verrucomicrobiae bacterium]